MGKLTRAQEAQRVAAVLRTIALVQGGEKLGDALIQVGLTRDQYNHWLVKSTEAVDLFYNLIQESEKRELVAILSSREQVLDNLISKVTAKSATVLDMLASLQYFDRRQTDLESKQGVSNNAEISAQEYLKGPHTEKKSSRLTATVTIEGSGQVTVSTRQSGEVIEGAFAPDPAQNLLLDPGSPHDGLRDLDLEADPAQQN